MNISQLEQQLQAALNRIAELEAQIQTIRKNTNQALTGHATIWESLVDHTKYRPIGKVVTFPRKPIDVGLVI